MSHTDQLAISCTVPQVSRNINIAIFIIQYVFESLYKRLPEVYKSTHTKSVKMSKSHYLAQLNVPKKPLYGFEENIQTELELDTFSATAYFTFIELEGGNTFKLKK